MNSKPLTEQIVNLLHYNNCYSKESAVSAMWVSAALGIEDSSDNRQTRALVRQAREQSDAIILSCSAGYYLARTPEDIDECIKPLRKHALSTLRMLKWLKRGRRRLAREQGSGTETGLLFGEGEKRAVTERKNQ